MALGADRYASRADALVFIACVVLSVAAMGLPESWRQPIARGLRASVLAPFLYLQQQSEELRTSRARYDQVVAQRDSTALAAGFVPELRSENARLRGLLGLGQRLSGGVVPAEVPPQPPPPHPPPRLLSPRQRPGVQPLAAVVSPEGLLGLVSAVDPNSSVAVTWAYPEFRASAMSEDGSVYGIVAPHGTEGPGVWLLELRGIAYRQLIPDGTQIVTSVLGGVLPRGIPIGTVIGLAGEAEGWERTYLVRPAVHPAAATHVMILTGPPARSGDLHAAFMSMGAAP